MSKGVYIGVSGYARKVKSMYIGVDGVARKIKKAYLGVEGYSRLFYSSGGIKLSDISISSLRNSHSYGASASTGSYAVFAGGSYSYYVDAYNSSLTKSSPSNLSNKVTGVCGCGFAGYGIFAGGYISTGSYYKSVDAYSASMTKSTLEDLSVRRTNAVMTHTANNLLIGGGTNSSGPVETGEAYNATLTKISSSNYGIYEKMCGVYSNGYGIIYGGMYNYNSSVTMSKRISFISDDLTIKANVVVATGVHSSAGASIGNFALFAGGDATFDGSVVSTVYACDSRDCSVRSITSLPIAVRDLAGTSVGSYAVFAGGLNGGASSGSSVDMAVSYDENLTRSILQLSTDRAFLLGASVSNYGLLAGGVSGSSTGQTNLTSVEVFEYGG